MSNFVILSLLGPLIQEILTSTRRYEPLSENHPLIDYIERRLSRLWALQGGLRCPELEKKLLELREGSPEKLKDIVEELVRRYYREKETQPRLPPLSLKRRRNAEEKPIEAVV